LNDLFPFLGFDLSTPATLVALYFSPEEGDFLLEREGSRAESLFPMIAGILKRHGLSPKELLSIGVGRGPGSFTGVRNAVMAAKIMAHIFQIPLLAPSTLEILAQSAGEADCVASVIDARRQEVYFALFNRKGKDLICLQKPAVDSPQAAAKRIGELLSPGEKFRLVGTGALLYQETFSSLGIIEPDPTPRPEGLLESCIRAMKRGESSDPIRLLPLYVRRPDAEEWKRKN
jgi:tRNA threonylcarbamoyladenosine biosynthesis protein TsaB